MHNRLCMENFSQRTFRVKIRVQWYYTKFFRVNNFQRSFKRFSSWGGSEILLRNHLYKILFEIIVNKTKLKFWSLILSKCQFKWFQISIFNSTKACVYSYLVRALKSWWLFYHLIWHSHRIMFSFGFRLTFIMETWK